jgi:hypothetical protein
MMGKRIVCYLLVVALIVACFVVLIAKSVTSTDLERALQSSSNALSEMTDPEVEKVVRPRIATATKIVVSQFERSGLRFEKELNSEALFQELSELFCLKGDIRTPNEKPPTGQRGGKVVRGILSYSFVVVRVESPDPVQFRMYGDVIVIEGENNTFVSTVDPRFARKLLLAAQDTP